MFLEIETNLTNGPQPDRILINLKKQAISVSVNTYTVYTFDLVGRLITLFDGGYTFRRSLDNRVMQKGSISTNGDTHHVRLWLNLKQRRNLIDQVHERIWRLYHLLKIHRLEVLSATPQDILAVREAIVNALEGILFFDFNQLENEAEIFSSIYGRVGILPPDMYLSILLQATQGCSYNKCSYCNFYKGESYRIKSEGEFLKHIRDVKGFFGGSLPLRKQLFLGEANALDLPQALLLRFFEEINQEFHFKGNSEAESGRPTPPLKGIYSFLSAFHKNRKTSDDFAELQAKHLRRVYIGMETGSNRLLK
ncbi:hypothetical protein GWO43_02685, partial [candidate division KSB1 bacterium]|nr:hypothetical protein [candidate division KSB1 bacterium]NIR69777.1 hypothetical protein [candidate division KSB1 bacterium]NIS22960.1 hypothetical protein [candidate division KSB1 bacterium]NIT69817.1 hypothetical protein [candidate division KSB1 bacterium]NIU23491.1 hypothetical protein [candidate division KSB1 bacterium]